MPKLKQWLVTETADGYVIQEVSEGKPKYTPPVSPEDMFIAASGVEIGEVIDRRTNS